LNIRKICPVSGRGIIARISFSDYCSARKSVLSIEYIINIGFLCSPIGTAWTSAIKDMLEHYSQREASYPVLKQVILDSLRKIKNEKTEEHNKVK